MILFGAFSTMVQDHKMDTAKDWDPTFKKKITKKKIREAIWSPQLIICPGSGKTKGGKYRDCNKLEDLEKVVESGTVYE